MHVKIKSMQDGKIPTLREHLIIKNDSLFKRLLTSHESNDPNKDAFRALLVAARSIELIESNDPALDKTYTPTRGIRVDII